MASCYGYIISVDIRYIYVGMVVVVSFGCIYTVIQQKCSTIPVQKGKWEKKATHEEESVVHHAVVTLLSSKCALPLKVTSAFYIYISSCSSSSLTVIAHKI